MEYYEYLRNLAKEYFDSGRCNEREYRKRLLELELHEILYEQTKDLCDKVKAIIFDGYLIDSNIYGMILENIKFLTSIDD